MNVRVRYAPSPTGLQHIGGVRTALFNYFYAKSTGGKFILRVEDTDRVRTTPEAVKDLYETLEWLGITWDEGPDKDGPFSPYVQSERFALYAEYAQKLVDDGKAYKCYCSTERLDQMRAEQEKEKKPIGYDRRCRHLTPEQRAEFEKSGIKPVIRFAVPLEGVTTLDDVLLGRIDRANIDISPDPVLLKADGFPTYHLANVIDDHLMEISHILRAQEWIPSGPLHVLLYAAFGWTPPVYCHLPMVMGTDGQKLSKRHGATSVLEFRKAGYLPAALLNYVSLLGWSFDGQTDLLSKEQLEKSFCLENLSKAPGIFDYKKLEWFNGMYIRAATPSSLGQMIRPWLVEAGILEPQAGPSEAVFQAAIPLIQERIKLLSEAPDAMRFFFADPVFDPATACFKKTDAATTASAAQAGLAILESSWDLPDEELEHKLFAKAEELGHKVAVLMMPLRVGVTGSSASPPLLPCYRILGKETVLRRVNNLIQQLQKM
jgi:glutamyl-tRNA synthetase